MPDAVKLSSPATGEFWKIPILFADSHLLALNKPAGLAVSPDSAAPDRPDLMGLLHEAIERGAPWAKQLGLDYLMNAHPLDAGATGVVLMSKNKAAHVALAAQFGSEQPCRTYAALARGPAPAAQFETDAKLAPHPLQMGIIRVDTREGKRSRTLFAVREQIGDYVLLECRPFPDRPHQVRVHLRHLRLPLVGDDLYGGRPLFLSTIKPGYRAKVDQEERPLLGRPALHLEQVCVDHPATGAKLVVPAPLPKDFVVSIKYLRRFAGGAA